ncbi:N-acetyl-gamma-glutamyl-phosphate reductase [Limnoglobus roseus]|uniref:N-acetyl-gamma-glutamyl-phosphate reductase n=1 Tax=Limnoglobus roseus TaxID=2598579 RepID=A0A5C1AN09_9BACT|nr:N-acetyl-gamma-glutamyl-phosphate reductase [Limnoglobus roseus]
MNKVKCAVLGGSGYTAVELLKILLRHPHAEVVAVTSRQEAGKPVSAVHPVLTNRFDLPMENLDPAALQAKGVECVFGCLPHGTSMEVIPPLLDLGMRVIDLSADYRLADPVVYAEWYKETHHDTANLEHAVYGLPELFANAIRGAKLVANPGCYPQTGILGLAPLIRANLIEREGIIIDSKSGVSGAGRTPKLSTLFPECNESVSAYGIGTHRHTPEIEQALSIVGDGPVQVIFTPHLMPMDRGIFSTIYATPRLPLDEGRLVKIYKEYYRGKPFVRVRDTLPATKDTAHTNYLDLYVKLVRGRILILAAEDNLVRGASGVAVQNFNLMFGFDETTALE